MSAPAPPRRDVTTPPSAGASAAPTSNSLGASAAGAEHGHAHIAIVGAGPAGIAAACWLRALDVPFRWFEASDLLGGTLRRVGNPVANFVFDGAPLRGVDLASRLAGWAADNGVAPERGCAVALHAVDGGWEVSRSGGAAGGVGDALARVAHVIVCTGSRPRLLGLPDEASLLGRGVEVSVTRNLDRYAGKRVAVVGGGDAACEGALLLAPVCPSVVLVHRGAALRCQPRFAARIASSPNIGVRLGASVSSLRVVDGALTGVLLADGSMLDVDGLFVRIGVDPSVPPGDVRRAVGVGGYLLVDGDGRTALGGLWAAGDCAAPAHQSVAWAVGAGARAAAAAAAALREAA